MWLMSLDDLKWARTVIQCAAVEVDRHPEPLGIAKATGPAFDVLDLCVERLGAGVWDSMCEVGLDVGSAGLDHQGDLLDRLDLRATCPLIPIVEMVGVA